MARLSVSFFVLIAMLGSLAQASDCRRPVDPKREIMITDLSVVNDARATTPGGPWTFAFLMRQMAPVRVDPSDFVLTWLNEWKVNHRFGFSGSKARTEIQRVIDAWPRKAGKLDLDKAPFRLTAISNRMDLRSPFVDGGAGEGRFVFGMVDTAGEPVNFTVIFEYLQALVPQRGMTTKFWADHWHDLGTLSFGPAYNARLERITRAFSSRNAFPGRVNGSALNQLRTNETLLANSWEQREFRLDRRSGMLLQNLTKQNPDVAFNDPSSRGGAEFIQWVNDHQDELLKGRSIFPTASLGGFSSSPILWLPALDRDPKMQAVRKAVGMETCGGCHSVETGTKFLHLPPRRIDQPTTPSAFVLSEISGKRAKYLQAVVCGVPDSALPMTSRVH